MAVKSNKNTVITERFKSVLAFMMKDMGLSLTEFAKKIDVGTGTLSNFLKNGASAATMEDVAEKLGVDLLDMLMEGRTILAGKKPEDDSGARPLSQEELESHEFLRVPFADHMRLAAGGGGSIPFTYDVDTSPVVLHRSALAHVRIPNVKNLQAFRIGGDSMEPTLKEGGIVVVDKTKNDLSKLDEGEIYVLCSDLSTEECAVKRLKWAKEGVLLAVESENRAYPTIYAEPENVLLIGKVIWSWREH